jgi:hypothetical protein
MPASLQATLSRMLLTTRRGRAREAGYRDRHAADPPAGAHHSWMCAVKARTRGAVTDLRTRSIEVRLPGIEMLLPLVTRLCAAVFADLLGVAVEDGLPEAGHALSSPSPVRPRPVHIAGADVLIADQAIAAQDGEVPGDRRAADRQPRRQFAHSRGTGPETVHDLAAGAVIQRVEGRFVSRHEP